MADYLCNRPTDFKGAIARLRPDLQGLYLAAYQSALWNRMLAAWLVRSIGGDNLATLELKLGRVPVPIRLPTEAAGAWTELTLPLPSARIKLDPTAPWARVVEEVLREEGLTLRELQVKGMHKPFFSKGDRSASVRPMGLQHDVATDERNAGHQKLVLRFELPRGSYATILVKRVPAVMTFGSAGPTGDAPDQV
jgi:tRNA pseudouridine13 synthase